MPDVEQELARFGRWLDTEIEARGERDVRPFVAPVAGGPRWPRLAVMGAAAAAAVAVLLATTLWRDAREPAISPGPSTTAPASTTSVTTAGSSGTTGRSSTTAGAPASVPVASSPSVAPVDAPADAPTTATTVATTRARSTVVVTEPPTTQAVSVATATTPAPSAPPTVATTEPPTTQPPATTAVADSCGQPKAQAVGRNGNVFYYRICKDGLRYSGSSTTPGWSTAVPLKGPPSVSVTFSNGSVSVSCTLDYDRLDNLVLASGDC